MKVKCLAHEHNTVFPTRSRTWNMRPLRFPSRKRRNSGQIYMRVFSAGLYYILGLLVYTTQMNRYKMYVCMYVWHSFGEGGSNTGFV